MLLGFDMFKMIDHWKHLSRLVSTPRWALKLRCIQKKFYSYFEKKKILDNLKIKELSLKTQINDLDFKNSLLSDNLDLDYVEILIRERFLFGKKNEKIYILKK